MSEKLKASQEIWADALEANRMAFEEGRKRARNEMELALVVDEDAIDEAILNSFDAARHTLKSPWPDDYIEKDAFPNYSNLLG